MTLIERLLSVQTLQGPYLGESKPVVQALNSPNFQSLVTKTVATPVLQSAAQQLQLNITVKAAPVVPPTIPQSTGLLGSGSNLMGPSRLSPMTTAQLQQHPVECRLDLAIDDLLLLEVIRRQVRKRPAEQLMPTPFAQLTWVPFDRPFSRLAASRRKLQVNGMNFMRFRFSWEEDDEAKERRRQKQRRLPEPDNDEAEFLEPSSDQTPHAS